MLVRGVVVGDQVQRLVLRRLAIDLAREFQPPGVGMSLLALADGPAIQNIGCGEQGGRSVALVVVRMVAARPFLGGSPGCVRSGARTWLFSSQHKTKACSGGDMYKPTMSSSFSTKFGSRETLNPRTMCGFSPAARQCRETLGEWAPSTSAILRVLQCVAAPGLLCVVNSTKRATSAFFGGAPRGKSRSIPANRISAYRPLQRAT